MHQAGGCCPLLAVPTPLHTQPCPESESLLSQMSLWQQLGCPSNSSSSQHQQRCSAECYLGALVLTTACRIRKMCSSQHSSISS